MSKDRREYFRRRREKLAQDQEWKAAESRRKAAWYAANRKSDAPRPTLTDEERRARRRQYDKARRAEIANDPDKHEKEKARKRDSYHRNKKR